MTNNELLKLAKEALEECRPILASMDTLRHVAPSFPALEKVDAAIEALSSPIDKGETKPHFDYLAGGANWPESSLTTLIKVRQCLQHINDNESAISDTLWYSDHETLFDYMDAAIAAQSGREATEGNK